MEFVRNTLTRVNLQDDTLYEIIYDLFFFAKLKDSEDNIKKGKICTLEELKKHIDELEAQYEDNNIR